jgi:hypothetical protein
MSKDKPTNMTILQELDRNIVTFQPIAPIAVE